MAVSQQKQTSSRQRDATSAPSFPIEGQALPPAVRPALHAPGDVDAHGS